LAREAASSGDRIMAEAYWQYADHYFRVIQTMGGFVQRNNQGWGDGQSGEEGQQGNPPQQGQLPNPQQANGYGQGEHRQSGGQGENRQGGGQGENRQSGQGGRGEQGGEAEPGLGGVAFLQNGRGGGSADQDPAAEDQPDIPEFSPPAGRRGERG
jgi:hypothetical protein